MSDAGERTPANNEVATAPAGQAGGDKAAKGKRAGKKGEDVVRLPAWRLQALNILPWACAGIMAGAWLLSKERGPLGDVARKMTTVSYPVQVDASKDTGVTGATVTRYNAGADDRWLVFMLVVSLTFGRWVAQRVIFWPLGWLMGVKGAGDTHKFAEMGWQLMWYLSAEVAGFTIATSEWDLFDTTQLWVGYPHNRMTLAMKLYYLTQLSFWLHMIFVTVLEAWRKDFVEMMAHHFITSFLVASSYQMSYTRVGVAILVEQDIADILLPLAKMFNYAKWKTFADITFALFAVVWIVTRHVIFFFIYYSIYAEAHVYAAATGYWDTADHAYWDPFIPRLYLVFLGIFQALLCFWLWQILIAVKKALLDGHIEDHRSDDEDEGAEPGKQDKVKDGKDTGKGKGKGKGKGQGKGKKE